jgi:hypothetical protein
MCLWDTAAEGSGRVGSAAMNPEILRYIAANRDTYTREAITRQLIQAGHNPAEIDRACESIEPRPESRLPRDRTFWRYFFIYVVAMYGLTFLVCALRLGIGTLVILGVFLLLEAWISIRMVPASPAVARAVAKGAASGLLIAVLIPFAIPLPMVPAPSTVTSATLVLHRLCAG